MVEVFFQVAARQHTLKNNIFEPIKNTNEFYDINQLLKENLDGF